MKQMTIQAKIDKLKSYRFIEDRIGSLKSENNSIVDMIECLKRFKINVSQSSFDALNETISSNEKEIENLSKAECEINEAIDSLDDHRFEMILKARYINCLNWEQISVRYRYSRAQLNRIHNLAIEKIDL